MMYLAGQILACVGAAYLGAQAYKYDLWMVPAVIAVIVGIAMSVVGLKS